MLDMRTYAVINLVKNYIFPIPKYFIKKMCFIKDQITIM